MATWRHARERHLAVAVLLSSYLRLSGSGDPSLLSGALETLAFRARGNMLCRIIAMFNEKKGKRKPDKGCGMFPPSYTTGAKLELTGQDGHSRCEPKSQKQPDR